MLTLLTFYYKKKVIISSYATTTQPAQLTWPPGPELLENVKSTKFLSILASDAENFSAQFEASECSFSVVSWARVGGFGKADGGDAVRENVFGWFECIVVVLMNSLDHGFTLKRHAHRRLDVIRKVYLWRKTNNSRTVLSVFA